MSIATLASPNRTDAGVTEALDAPPRRDSRRLDMGRLEIPLLIVLLIGTGAGYLVRLGSLGWANAFYSAAVQASSVSWKAFFFGSSDAANSITVDKPPAALWVMDLSVRLFGQGSWSILVPEVLLGVASVAVVWATVRRVFGPAAGLLAGLVLAVTPVAALMFRFNNPDALLVFLMSAAAWAMTRAVADGRWRWLILAGSLIGFGFLTKQLAVLLVVPGFAAAYLLAGPVNIGKRLAQVGAAGVSLLVSAGWWVLAVALWPTASRPYIGGSQHNSIWELTMGYNGLGRLNGEEAGSVVPGRGDVTPSAGMWGQSGITRMFQPAQGGQIAWLIPAALVILVAGLLLAGKKPRTDAGRAQLVLWGGWLLGTGLVFSFMSGIFHQYYTVALAPAIAALVGMGATLLWRNRHLWWVRGSAAVAIGLSTATAWMLLGRSSDFLPWLRWTVLVGGVVATLGALPRWQKPAAGWIAALSAVVVLAGPVAYTVDTVVVGQGANGFIPSAGPRVANGFGNGGHGNPGGPGGLPGGGFPGGPMGGRGGAPGGPASPGMARQTGTAQHSPTRGGQHGPGGFMGSGKPSDQLVSMLKSHGSNYTWVAATMGSNSAAGYQLATGLPVMPIGGFNSTDPSPTLQQFQQDVAAGKIHYFLGGGQGGPFGGGNNSPNAAITQWVQQNFPAEAVDNTTVYDLTTPITH